MIEQQINLYQERFRERRLWVSAAQTAAALLLLLVLAGLSGYLLQADLDRAERRNQALKAERERVTSELSAVNADLARLLRDTRLEREIESAARQISARRKVLGFVDANRFGSGRGFSAYLAALSRLHQDDIWLNHISLGENYIRLEGSSLSAEQVPAYFDRFSSEAVFEGNRFDLFRVSRDLEHDWKVDFEIATSGGGDG